MIDIENEVFDRVATAVREAFPGIYMTGEYTPAPPSFPCVSLVERSNTVYERTGTGSEPERHAQLMYQLDVYSAKAVGKKTQCRQIAAAVDAQMAKLGFVRIMLQPVDNPADTSVYRMTGRYRAVVGQDNVIYRK